MNSIPSQILRVCAGPDRSYLTGDILNISWDPLPCHLQNGADITGYIIQYGPTSGGETQNVSSSSSRLLCGQESGGLYKCLMSGRFFIPFQAYTFQVAAINSYGVGPFSSPVKAMLNTQGMMYITCHHMHTLACMYWTYHYQ